MADTPPKDDKIAAPPPVDQLSVTHHRRAVGGREIAYTVTCGTLVLKEETEKDGKTEGEKPRASVFFIAYTLDDAGDRARRPLTFSFNGGRSISR
jgi:carboxypeptidase C (cathepsin A)